MSNNLIMFPGPSRTGTTQIWNHIAQNEQYRNRVTLDQPLEYISTLQHVDKTKISHHNYHLFNMASKESHYLLKPIIESSDNSPLEVSFNEWTFRNLYETQLVIPQTNNTVENQQRIWKEWPEKRSPVCDALLELFKLQDPQLENAPQLTQNTDNPHIVINPYILNFGYIDVTRLWVPPPNPTLTDRVINTLEPRIEYWQKFLTNLSDYHDHITIVLGMREPKQQIHSTLKYRRGMQQYNQIELPQDPHSIPAELYKRLKRINNINKQLYDVRDCGSRAMGLLNHAQVDEYQTDPGMRMWFSLCNAHLHYTVLHRALDQWKDRPTNIEFRLLFTDKMNDTQHLTDVFPEIFDTEVPNTDVHSNTLLGDVDWRHSDHNDMSYMQDTENTPVELNMTLLGLANDGFRKLESVI